MRDRFTDGFGAAVADIRQKLLEEGWFGKAVTPRRQNITIGSPGEEKSPGEQLGWWQRGERGHQPSPSDYDRAELAKDTKAPDRGIDL
jgi:hypothetical protein